MLVLEELRHMSISEPMPMSKPGPEAPRRIEVFTGAGRRRAWTPEEKTAFVAESHGAGETGCGVARRHGLTPQQLFTWRRESAHDWSDLLLDLKRRGLDVSPRLVI